MSVLFMDLAATLHTQKSRADTGGSSAGLELLSIFWNRNLLPVLLKQFIIAMTITSNVNKSGF